MKNPFYYILCLFIFSLLSCKKEYKCCWYLDDKIEENVGFCTTDKLTKKEADNQSRIVNDYEWRCDKK